MCKAEGLGKTRGLAVLDAAAESPSTSTTLEVEGGEKPKRTNMRERAALGAAQMAHCYSITSIFAFSGYYVVDMNWTDSVDEAGYVAGLLAAALPFGRVFTSSPWGAASDRIGNKWAIVLSMLSIAIGNLAFPFAPTLWSAIGCRLIFLGALNGWATVMGPVCLEVGGEDGQAHVFAQVLGAGTAMAVMAPSLGAFAYGSLGTQFPALGPGIIGLAIGAIATLACYLWLPADAPKQEASVSSTTPSGGAPSVRSALGKHPLPLITLLRALNGWVLFAVGETNPLYFIGSVEVRRRAECSRGQRRLTSPHSLLRVCPAHGPCHPMPFCHRRAASGCRRVRLASSLGALLAFCGSSRRFSR